MARPLFSRFSLVLAQNEALARRFKTLGAPAAMACRQPQDRYARRRRWTPPELERLQGGARGPPDAARGGHARGRGRDRRRGAPPAARTLPGSRAPSSPRAIPSAAPAIAEMLPVAGDRCGAARARRAARRAPAEVYVADTLGELGTLYKLADRRLRRRVAGRPRRAQPDRGRAPRRRRRSPGRTGRTSPIPTTRSSTAAAPSRCSSAAELADAAEPLLAERGRACAHARARAKAALAGLSGALPRTVEALLRYLPGEDELARAS